MKEASHSITVSERLKKVLEIILALGNFMNSQRKGLAVGFKIQSLSKVGLVVVKCTRFLYSFFQNLTALRF